MVKQDFANDFLLPDAEDLPGDQINISWLIPLLFLPIVFFVGWTVHDYVSNQGPTNVINSITSDTRGSY